MVAESSPILVNLGLKLNVMDASLKSLFFFAKR